MKPNEIRSMSGEQLAVALTDTEKHLFQLRFQSATDRLETKSELKKAKRDIARLRTERRRRELGQLPALPDDQLTAALAVHESRTTGPGKRRAKRAIVRLTAIQAARANASAKAK